MYGYQDYLVRPLTSLELLTVRMDNRAKNIAQNHLRYRFPAQTERIEGYGTVTIADLLVTSSLQSTLCQNILHQQMVEYISNQFSIEGHLITIQVDCHSFDKGWKEGSFPIQWLISKWISEDTATGRVITQRRKQSRTSPTYTHLRI